VITGSGEAEGTLIGSLASALLTIGGRGTIPDRGLGCTRPFNICRYPFISPQLFHRIRRFPKSVQLPFSVLITIFRPVQFLGRRQLFYVQLLQSCDYLITMRGEVWLIVPSFTLIELSEPISNPRPASNICRQTHSH